jgi:predicted aspartyl protease
MKSYVCIVAALILMSCAGGSAKTTAIEFHDQSDETTVPLRMQRTSEIGGVPATDVEIDGYRLNFLVDTGASHCVIDFELAQKLNLSGGKSKRVILFGGARKGKVTTINELKLGGVTFRNAEAVILDLSLFRQELGIDVDGFLGGTALSSLAFTLDYPGGRMILHRFGTGLSENTALPFSIRNGLPVIQFGLTQGVQQNFILDTGSASALILLPTYLEELRIETADYPSVKTKELGGTLQPHFAQISRLDFGNSSLGNVPVMLLAGQKSGDIGGLIGSGLLENYRVTFDYKEHKLWLTPTDPRLILAGGFGLILHIDRDGVYVRAVAGQSPAHDAGIKAGDRVVSVDKHSPQTITGVWNILHARQQAEFTILRSGAMQTYDLVRARFLPTLKTVAE